MRRLSLLLAFLGRLALSFAFVGRLALLLAFPVGPGRQIQHVIADRRDVGPRGLNRPTFSWCAMTPPPLGATNKASARPHCLFSRNPSPVAASPCSQLVAAAMRRRQFFKLRFP